MPQPLSSFPEEKVLTPPKWGADNLDRFPNFALQIAQTISTWSMTDRMISLSITNFLRSDYVLVNAMMKDLRRDAVSGAFETAARLVLPQDDATMFSLALKTTKASRTRRDEFAHHIWGWVDTMPDALLLADPRDISSEGVAVFAALRGQVPQVPMYAHGLPWDTTKYYVYRENDFKAAVVDAKRAYDISLLLNRMSAINIYGPERYKKACDDLRMEPLVAQALQHHANRMSRQASSQSTP